MKIFKIILTTIFILFAILNILLVLAGANGKHRAVRECQIHPWTCE